MPGSPWLEENAGEPGHHHRNSGEEDLNVKAAAEPFRTVLIKWLFYEYEPTSLWPRFLLTFSLLLIYHSPLYTVANGLKTGGNAPKEFLNLQDSRKTEDLFVKFKFKFEIF